MDDFDVDPRPQIERTERSREVDRIIMNQQQAELAKEQSAMVLAAMTIRATQVVAELLEDEDPQVRARAVELVYSRTIPKVAAKHLEEVGETFDSADVAAMRQSIYEIVKKVQ